MSADLIRSEIAAAWNDVSLVPANEIEYSTEGLHLEQNAVARFFGGKKWSDVSWRKLQNYKGDCSACLSFMSPAAYRYYLPAYMLIALDHFMESDVTANSAWWSLSPPDDPSLHQYWSERVSGFSPAQGRAVLSFLRYMLREHGDEYPSDAETLRNAITYWETVP